MATKGYGSPEAKGVFDRANERCEQSGDSSDLMSILIGLRAVNQVQGNSHAARDFSVRCIMISERLCDNFFNVLGHASLAHTLSLMGFFSEAREAVATAVREYRPGDFARATLAFGIDPKFLP